MEYMALFSAWLTEVSVIQSDTRQYEVISEETVMTKKHSGSVFPVPVQQQNIL